jgi:hypothetical protein
MLKVEHEERMTSKRLGAVSSLRLRGALSFQNCSGRSRFGRGAAIFNAVSARRNCTVVGNSSAALAPVSAHS